MYPFRKFLLEPTPTLEAVAQVLSDKLPNQFEQVRVTVLDQCPDLTGSPFRLAAPGLGSGGHGRTTAIADVGGVLNLAPMPNRNKIYRFDKIADIVDIGSDSCSVIGASAGPFHKIGHNCELMPNLHLRKQDGHFQVENDQTYYAEIDSSGSYRLAQTTAGEFGLLGNLFISDGSPGPVLKIEAEKRTGKDDFVTTLRNILRDGFTQPVSLGGVFLIETGNANLHIMPDFARTPLMNEAAVNRWLRFFEMNAPLVCLTTLHSRDPGLSLRIDHTHCFSDHNQGGHYHYDTTPDNVRYLAYLNVADAIYRVDEPTKRGAMLNVLRPSNYFS